MPISDLYPCTLTVVPIYDFSGWGLLAKEHSDF